MSEASEPLALESGAHQRLLDLFETELGDRVLDTYQARGDLWVRVANDAWHTAFELLREPLDWKYFLFLSGIDWMLNPALSGEGVFKNEDDAAPTDSAEEPAPEEIKLTSGYCGTDGRFQVFARVMDLSSSVGVTLKADLTEPELRIRSVADVYRGADWHEREAFEMYGFHFDGHPGLRKLYLPAEFEGHPLRKDFPLLARVVKPWPGIVNVEPIPDHLDPKKIEERKAAEAAAAAPTDGAGADGAGAGGESAEDAAAAKAKADRLAAMLAKSKARKGGGAAPAAESAEQATTAPTEEAAKAAAKPADPRLAALMERSKARKAEKGKDS